MASNHPSELTPRQRMINMMYLVLTALLALNVSKDVLRSFWDAKMDIADSRERVEASTQEKLAALESDSRSKVKRYSILSNQVDSNTTNIVNSLQKLKYNLLLSVDGEVHLGKYKGDGKGVKKKWEKLTSSQKNQKIVFLNAKENRDASGKLFKPIIDGKLNKKGEAYKLKKSIKDHADYLFNILDKASNGDTLWVMVPQDSGPAIKTRLQINAGIEVENLKKKIKASLNVNKIKDDDGNVIEWEEAYFLDQPAVGVITKLEVLQIAIRNMSDQVIALLAKSVDVNTLKVTSLEAIQVPEKTVLMQGEKFSADIFLTARDDNSQPKIFVTTTGDLQADSSGNYNAESMVGKFYELDVKSGKANYKPDELGIKSGLGINPFKGLIQVEDADGYDFYPFSGEYLVSENSAVVSPTNMNLLYLKVDNPMEVSAANLRPDQLTVNMSNGSIRAVSKSKGTYIAVPLSEGTSKISVYGPVNGKNQLLDFKEFRVRPVPPPIATINKKEGGGISKSMMLASNGIRAELRNFDFKGVRYKIIGFTLTTVFEGDQVTERSRGPKFTQAMRKIIKNTSPGTQITISDLKARRTDAEGLKSKNLPPAVFKIIK